MGSHPSITWKALHSVSFCLSLIWFVANPAQGQDTVSRYLGLHGGLQHNTFLDRQATPLPHSGTGGVVGLQFGHRKIKHLWQLEARAGRMAFQPAEEAFRYYDPEPTATTAHFDLAYLRLVRLPGPIKFYLGGSLREDILVDFEGIGNWPYLFASGGFFARGRLEYNASNKHRFSTGLSVPVLPWITDMPYNQIPRIVGRVPDALTLFKVGSRLVFWNSFQRVDLRFSHDYLFSKHWSSGLYYDWTWYHDSVPRGAWAYQGQLTFNISYRW